MELSSLLSKNSNYEINGSTILKEVDRSNKVDDGLNIVDDDWVKNVFLIKSEELSVIDNHNRFKTSASFKFTDTRMGGNIGINARPQYTRYADIRMPGRITGRNEVTVANVAGNYGMGRWYSETIDDNSQTVFMEFGMPEFTSMLTFFSRAVDYPTSVIANTGRYPTMYFIGKAIGAVATFVAFPLLSIAVYAYKYIRTYLPGLNSYSYYWLKPTMHLYWSAVNNLVTNIAVELGILPRMMTEAKDSIEQPGKKIGMPLGFDQEHMDQLQKLLPGIITNNNYIDVFAIANRAQVIANKQATLEYEAFAKNKSDKNTLEDYILNNDPLADVPPKKFSDHLNEIFKLADYKTDQFRPKDKKTENKTDNTPTTKKESEIDIDDEIKDKKVDAWDFDVVSPSDATEMESKLNQFAKYFDATVRDGSRFATFKVDYVGSISESFSNSTTEIPVKDKLKGLTTKTRDIKFSMSGGNISSATSFINDAVTGIKDFAMGALDGITFGLSNVLASVLEGGFIDIPKMWDDSSVSLPKLNFTMQLISPYGNPISQLQNIYIPLSMILAGALPISTGKASYTSPFLCSMYLRGMQNIKLGIITDVSITRGTSNLAWNKQGRALAIDVSFSVTDLSSIMHVPIAKSVFDVFSVNNDEDTLLSNYVATIAGRDLASFKYFAPKARLTAAKRLMATEAILSPANWGMMSGDLFGDMLGLFVPGAAVAYNKDM